MARMLCTATLVVMLNVLVGCNEANSGKGQIIAPVAKSAMGSDAELQGVSADEMDLVEQMATYRKAYRQSLELLLGHYTNMGNNMKLQWAKKELAELDAIPQYRYVIEAGVAGPDLSASTSIPEADQLYEEALSLHKQAQKLLVIKDKDLLRMALDRYNQIFRQYPTSDKIDDAAFKAGTIYEHFKDYSIAALYYERTYQWDPATTHPARFKRAYILDNQLHRRAEALVLYQEALEIDGAQDRYKSWIEYAQRRVGELTKTAEETTTQ